MTPVESLWIVLVVLFGIVGIVRGFLKELGVTLVLVVMLFGLERLSANMQRILDALTGLPYMKAVGQLYGNATVWLIFYTGIILIVMYIAYQGYVIKYPGNDPKGIEGTLLSLMIGLINGYLFAGSLWFYINTYKDPLVKLGLIQGDYTPLAQKLLEILPPKLLGPFLPFLVVFMIILLVIK
jgi:hypothetical protein